ncbi:MAG: alcohol dehydrogenase catalytic domain-containing protein [Anaerolineaceae bacterium]
MSKKYEVYRSLDYTLPQISLGWNLYDAGLENMGKEGKPEAFPVPEPGDDQLLVRIDSVGICFSDIKVIKQGRHHPKLYNRDMRLEPTRLGHEVSLTVIKAGKNLEAKYHPGERFAVQPDIFQKGMSAAYGYTVPGGLIQYHLIGKEVFDTDTGVCLLPLEDEMGYAESSLLEPWGCVMAAYTQRRRLIPLTGGVMWIVGQPGGTAEFTFSAGLEKPNTIVLTDVPTSVKALVKTTKAVIIERDGLAPSDYAQLNTEITEGHGFDDIVVLNPVSAEAVGQINRQIARRGTCNLVGTKALDGLVDVDFGRLHYDYITFLGNKTSDIALSYGEARNRCELRAGGCTVFIGAGGPMGQMHVQRALELPSGPKTIIATEVSDERLETLSTLFSPLAKKHGKKIFFFNPMSSKQSFYDFVMEVTAGEGADDVIVSVPVAKLMEEGDTVMKADGMLVLFAGVPIGTVGKVKLSNVYLSNAQYTGTSGLTINDQALVMQRRMEGTLSPGRSVAAIGGIETAAEALQSVMDGRFPGKVVVFPQIEGLPLTGLKDLKDVLPEVAAKLGDDMMWTNEAEEVLINLLWKTPA